MSKKILITGSNGLLGQKLVELIIKDPNYALIATARGANRLPKNIKGYIYEAMDVTNREETLSKIQQLKSVHV